MPNREKSADHLKHISCRILTPMLLPFKYDKTPLNELIVLLTLSFTFVFSYVGIGLFLSEC